MPRTYGKLQAAVWDPGSDFRRLTLGAQWAYVMLISQPDTEMCGVLLYAPRKWARLAAALEPARVEELLDELEAAGYVIVDRESEELLIRSFVKHDRPWKFPNNLLAARRRFAAVESERIRDYLATRHEWLQPGSDLGPAEVEEYEAEHARNNARSDTRSDARGDTRTDARSDAHPTRANAGGALPLPLAPAQELRGEGVGDTPRAQSAPLEAPQARADESQDEEGGRLGVRAECPVCGPLHAVALGFDLEAHVRDVHGLELADVLASRSGEG